ncbi:B-cell receptor CD22-like [Pleurodeles waltl]|uniref:B-cell receptor CD22-like n=1 Tax=Pleurodeles waltl TaxID=8319 RepID=UPI003709AF44
MDKLFLIAILQVSISQVETDKVKLTVRALRGSCVVIPCTFSNPEPLTAPEELSIKWQRAKIHSLIYSGEPSDPVLPDYRGRTKFVGDLKSGDCSLQISSVRGDDAGDYYPWIVPLSKDYELYRVTVSDNPDEIAINVPGLMTEGTPVKITCSVVHTCPSSPPSLSWDWKDSNVRNYHEDLSNGRWKVVSEMYYTPMAQDHGKSLQCTATYTKNITPERNITMAIRYSPKNTTAVVLGNATLREGDTMTLRCSAVGNPDVSNYSWYTGEEAKPLLGRGQDITVQNILWNSGPYSCITTNEVGSGNSTPLELNIEYAPKEVQVIVKPNPVEGAPLTIACRVSSSNPPVTRYTWYKDGLLMNVNSSALNWTKVTSENSGRYHCMAHNTLGNSSSSPANVSVHYPPKGTQIYVSETKVKEGERMALECKINSSNPVVDHYSWFKNGNQLQNQSRNILIIEKSLPDDSGTYQCEARNEAGNSSSTPITVNVQGSSLLFKNFATLGGTTAFLLLLLLALFIFFWRSQNKEKKQADQSHSIPKVTEEEIVYVTIDHSKESRTQKRKVPSDDFVTYAAVRRNPDPDGAYAEVRKPLKTPKKEEEEVIYATDLKFNCPTTNGSESCRVRDDFVEYAAVKR